MDSILLNKFNRTETSAAVFDAAPVSAAFLATLVTTGSGPTWPGATTGLLSDESGRLDPNQLSSLAWRYLLAAVGIQGWNGETGYPSSGPMPPGDYPPGTYVPSADGLGELAKALAGLPSQLPSSGVRALAQSLLANPQLPPGTSAPGWTKLRWPLTHVCAIEQQQEPSVAGKRIWALRYAA